jgi:5-methyltetrahydropteroyltriglutamate--homocysteine methyltransferase
MNVWASPLGGYPRSRVVRRALRDYERGLLGYGELERVVGEASSLIIGSQLSSGLTYAVDGMVDWHDIFRPFIESWRNVTASGLLRYFDNNFFYRIPVFTEKPEASKLVWAPRVRRYAPLAEPSGLKIVVPGPVTFTSMSINKTGYSNEELAEAIAKLLADEVKAAIEAGASMVQVDEPMLADHDATRDEALLAVELVNSIVASAGGAKTALALYFDVPRGEVYDAILDVKANCISLDVVDAPERALKLIESKGFSDHCGILGLVNSRTIYDDPVDKLVEVALRVARSSKVGEMGVTTTTWLDLIPYSYSLRKTYLLGVLTLKIQENVGVAGGV